MNPKISIITPLFNRSDLIADTINSVLQQSCPDWELLIVDDHSTDNSLEIASRFSDNENRIQCWSRRSAVKGAPACRNEGAKAAKGEFLIFLDSDDLLASTCLEQRLKTLSQVSENELIASPGERFNFQPGDLGQRWFSPKAELLTGFLERTLWQTSAVTWRKKIFDHISGFREDLLSWQDWELHIRALANGHNIVAAMGSSDYFIRRGHETRISQNSESKKDHLLQRRSLFIDIISMLKSTDNWSQVNESIMIRKFIFLALQMKRSNFHEHANNLIESLKEVFSLDTRRHQKMSNYYEFERRSLSLRPAIIRKLVRLVGKQYHRLHIGSVVIPRSKQQ